MFHSGSSNFFTQQTPERFGGQQGDYLEQVRNVVSKTASQIQESVDSKKDLEEVFSSILNNLAKTRSDIAFRHNTKNKKKFGQFREKNEKRSGLMHTPLSSPYLQYNDRLLQAIIKHLKLMKHTNKSFEQTELKIQDNAFGRQTSWDICVMPVEKKSEWGAEYSISYYKTICRKCGILPLNDETNLSDCFNSLMEKSNLKIIKEKSIIDYKKLKMMDFIKDIYTSFEGKKSDWILVTVRCEIQGKLYALTQFCTWMYRTYNDDPVEYMLSRPDKTYISLIHQDPFLIKDSLTEIGKVFKKAVEWNREEGLEKLTHLVADITYLFSHAMPLERGSAAVGEWLEMALYQYHGFTIKYAEGICVNMEALTLPYKEFMVKYPSFLKIEPNNTSEARPSP